MVRWAHPQLRRALLSLGSDVRSADLSHLVRCLVPIPRLPAFLLGEVRSLSAAFAGAGALALWGLSRLRRALESSHGDPVAEGWDRGLRTPEDDLGKPHPPASGLRLCLLSWAGGQMSM